MIDIGSMGFLGSFGCSGFYSEQVQRRGLIDPTLTLAEKAQALASLRGKDVAAQAQQHNDFSS